MPHNDAGYTSAVVTLDQSLPKAIAIGPGPYTSRHDEARVGPGPFSHIALFLPGRRRMLPSARRLHVPIAIFKEARNGKETSTSCDGKGRATWLGNMSEPPPPECATRVLILPPRLPSRCAEEENLRCAQQSEDRTRRSDAKLFSSRSTRQRTLNRANDLDEDQPIRLCPCKAAQLPGR
jgi:hypothetical protein